MVELDRKVQEILDNYNGISLDFSRLNLTSLPELPETLTQLYCVNNPIDYYYISGNTNQFNFPDNTKIFKTKQSMIEYKISIVNIISSKLHEKYLINRILSFI